MRCPTGLNPLYSHQIGAAAGYNLAWATTSPSVALLMWPVTAAFGPVAVVQPDAAARAADLGLGDLRRRPPADRQVLGGAAGRRRLRLQRLHA